MLSLKSYCILYTLSGVVRTAYKQTVYTIRQEVAYKRLKTMGNYKTVSSVVVVAYERWLFTRDISHKITLTPKRTRCFDSYVAIVLICH